ncbi:hypothetical protein ACROYT_G015305 [Oculina patagonica]
MRTKNGFPKQRKGKSSYGKWSNEEQSFLVDLWSEKYDRLESKVTGEAWQEICEDSKKNARGISHEEYETLVSEEDNAEHMIINGLDITAYRANVKEAYKGARNSVTPINQWEWEECSGGSGQHYEGFDEKDAVIIYGGKKIAGLEKSLPDPEVEDVYLKLRTKLNDHFTPKKNKHPARNPKRTKKVKARRHEMLAVWPPRPHQEKTALIRPLAATMASGQDEVIKDKDEAVAVDVTTAKSNLLIIFTKAKEILSQKAIK